MIVTLTIIFCVTPCITILISQHYITKRRELYNQTPQGKCSHEIETIKIWNGQHSSEYLSTCKKCGYQKRHYHKATYYRP